MEYTLVNFCVPIIIECWLFSSKLSKEFNYLKCVAKQFQLCVIALGATRADSLMGHHWLRYVQSISAKVQNAPSEKQIAWDDYCDDTITCTVKFHIYHKDFISGQ